MPSWLKTSLTILVMGLATLAHAEVAVPPAGSRVTDLTQTLSVEQTETLARELERIDQQTGTRVLVLMVPTLDGEPVEDFAQRVFDAWKPGRKGVDDGVLLVLAKHERKIRIAVGRGLEGAVPDLMAKRISQSSMVPAFEQGRFAEGFLAAAQDIEQLTRAEQLPAPSDKTASGSPAASTVSVLVVSGFLLLVIGGWWASGWRSRQEQQRRARELEDALAAQRARARQRTWAEPHRTTARASSPAPTRSTTTAPRRAAAAPAPASRRDDDSAPAVVYYGSSSTSSDNESRSSSNDYSTSTSDGGSSGGGASDSY